MTPCYLIVCLPVFWSMGWPAFPSCSPGTLACVNRAAEDLPVEGKDDCHLPYWELCLNANWVTSESGLQGWEFHMRTEQQRSPCSPILKPWAGRGWGVGDGGWIMLTQAPFPRSSHIPASRVYGRSNSQSLALRIELYPLEGIKSCYTHLPMSFWVIKLGTRGRQYSGTSVKHHVDRFSPQGKGERSFSLFQKPQVLCVDF